MSLAYKASYDTGIAYFSKSESGKTIKNTLQPIDQTVSMEFGIKYALNLNSFVKVKIDQAGKLAVCFSSIASPGMRFNFGGTFDTRKMQENVHKIGFSASFEG